MDARLYTRINLTDHKMNIRHQRLGPAVVLLIVCAIAGYAFIRRPTPWAPMSAESPDHTEPGVTAHVHDPVPPAFLPEADLDGEPPEIRAGRAPHRVVDETPFAAPAGVPTEPIREETLTLTPSPVTDDIQPYRARFQPAGEMELVQLPALSHLVRQRPVGDAPQMLNLPIPNGQMLPVEVLQHDRIALERGVFIGRVKDQPLSEVIVSYYEEAMTASMIVPGVGHYEIAYAGDDRYLLMEIDPDRLLPEAPPRVPPEADTRERMAP